MATYKKRSKGAKKNREEKIVSKSVIARFFSKLDFWASSFEDWIARNRVALFSVIGVIVIAVLGYLAYDNFVAQPRQEEAVKEMSDAMDYYNQAIQADPGSDREELLNKALHGAGGYGLLDIIDNYKGTDAANIAQYSAGIAYLNLRDYQKAIEHLEKFSGKDEFLPAIAKGAIGDAFVGNQQPEEALKYYEEAASIRTNTFTTPRYLLKAGKTALDVGNTEKARTLLQKLEKDYPDSPEAEQAAVYLGIAGNQ